MVPSKQNGKSEKTDQKDIEEIPSNEKSKELDEEEELDTEELDDFLLSKWKKTKTLAKNAWHEFVDDIKHPKKAFVELIKNKQFITTVLAIVVGIIGALAAWGFDWLSVGADYVFMGQLFGLMNSNFNSWKFLAIIFTPFIVSLFTAPILWKYNPESKGSGIPHVMESIALNDGAMRRRTPFIKMVTSAVSAGGGLSVGREGPITQIGAGFSASIARFVGLHGRNMRIIVIAGLSAGISATFKSPIGGALFGIEILLVSLVADEIVPIIIASLTASTLSSLIDILKLSPNSSGFPEPSFNVEALRNLDWTSYIYDLHWFILFGVIAGIVGVLYTKFFHLTKAIFKRLPIRGLFIPILGALLTGLVSLGSPKDVNGVPLIFGAGYTTITNILSNSDELSTQNPFNSMLIFLLLLILLKTIVTSFSVGSGNPGGIFAPALFIGACTGSLFANGINSAFGANVNVSVFALAGLAAVFAGATRAPLTMIFMGAEMTGNIMLTIPLMLTCSVSYLICRGLMKESIYTKALADKGLKITLGGNVTILSTTTVKDIMTTKVITVERKTTMKEVCELVESDGPFGYPVIDEQKKLIGMISLSDIRRAKMKGELEKLAQDFSSRNVIALYQYQTVDEAINILNRRGIKRAPVLDSPENGILVGILSKTDILRSFERQKFKQIKKKTDCNQGH